MGQCCSNKTEIKQETSNERHIIVDLEQTESKNVKILKIKNFISNNIEKIKKKKFNSKLGVLESLFCKETIEQEYIDLNYYKEQLTMKIEEVMEQKKPFFEELFTENLLKKINSFSYLREKLSNHYNDDIYENKINFYQDFTISLQETERFKKPFNKKAPRKSLNTNFINFISKNSKEKEVLIQKNSVGFSALNFGGINLDKEEKYLKKDIDILYKYCFDVEKLPTFDICLKRSKLLSIITEKKDIDKKMYISEEFQYFINSLYYIILLKKCECLAKTGPNTFYIINKKRFDYNYNKKEDLEEDVLMKYRLNSSKKKRDRTNVISRATFGGKSLRSKSKYERQSLLQKNSVRTSCLNTNANTELISTMTTEKEKEEPGILRTHRFKIDSANVNKNKIIEQIKLKRKADGKKLKTVIERNSSAILNKLKKRDSTKMFGKVMQTSNGEEEEYYSGQYDNTTFLYAGFGTLIEPEKNMCYIGTFRYGLKDGMGIQYEESENNMFIYYMGEFKNNKIDGYGEKINIKKNIFFYREGIFNGQVFLRGKVKILKDNVLKNTIDLINYNGDMSKDLFNGFGILNQKTYLINESNKYIFLCEKEYKGYFKNGKENGKGVMKYNNNTNSKNYQYSGNFVDGLREGFGIITYPENYFIQKYEGFFKKDKPFCTYGIVYFKSGDKYEGFFNEDYQKDFCGEYFCYDPVSKTINEQYFGGFMADSKHGLGKIYSENKKGSNLMVGGFNSGEKEGFFEMNEYACELVKVKINSSNRRRRMTSWNFGDSYENKLQKNQKKFYLLIEGNEIMEKCDCPIDI